MSRSAQQPTERPSDDAMGGTIIEHPAFGHIGASRVTGGSYLFGSDFNHHGHIRITISTAQLRRGLSRDWTHSGRELIEIAVSEAQWATFVSTLNSGGTECTLIHANRQTIPEIAAPKPRRDQFADEFTERLSNARGFIDEAVSMLKASGLSAKKAAEIASKLEAAQCNMGTNLKFVAQQFDKHMENTVEKAKIEINAYTTQAVHRAGLDAIKQQATLQIEGE